MPRSIRFLKCHENLLSQIMKLLEVAVINCCDLKKSQKVTLHDLDYKEMFE